MPVQNTSVEVQKETQHVARLSAKSRARRLVPGPGSGNSKPGAHRPASSSDARRPARPGARTANTGRPGEGVARAGAVHAAYDRSQEEAWPTEDASTSSAASRAGYRPESDLRLEFYTVANEPNPSGCPLISWQLRLRENGPVVMRSTERWITLAKARSDTGLLLESLFENQFGVYDLTRSSAAKTPAARSKNLARSSTAAR